MKPRDDHVVGMCVMLCLAVWTFAVWGMATVDRLPEGAMTRKQCLALLTLAQRDRVGYICEVGDHE